MATSVVVVAASLVTRQEKRMAAKSRELPTRTVVRLPLLVIPGLQLSPGEICERAAQASGHVLRCSWATPFPGEQQNQPSCPQNRA